MLIPYSFIRSWFGLTWSEALWGYERQMIGWQGLSELATDNISQGDTSLLTIELASITKLDASIAGDLLRELASNGGTVCGETCQQKWLFLNLAWLYENRNHYSDPLAIVEEIYADFNYPSEIESFVRYMPANDDYDPTNHSVEDNEERLIRKWNVYLTNAAKQLDPKRE